MVAKRGTVMFLFLFDVHAPVVVNHVIGEDVCPLRLDYKNI